MNNEDNWKLVALEFEYGPDGVSDEYWDQNFTKDMIRNDMMWLISKIKELKKLQDIQGCGSAPSPASFCSSCSCGKKEAFEKKR